MTFENIEQLNDALSDPPPYVIESLRKLDGDLMILGVAGKMGPTLARMAQRAGEAAGVKRRIIGVARFSNPAERARLDQWGMETIACDLLDEAALAKLPECPNVVYMAGMKFGSTGKEALTWAMNCFLPGRVAQKFHRSRIAAFSTGNIYGLSPVSGGGSIETDIPNPMGEYAVSCLGRERILEHFSRTLSIPVSIIRLNYACELQYGVLVDLARQIWEGKPVNLAMGNFNVIWQADANAMTLASLEQASSPPFILNVTGPETLSVRRVCEQLAALMDKPVTFEGREASEALLNNAALSYRLYGYPRIGTDAMIRWVADWTRRGGKTHGKPTHFEARDGKF